MTKLEKRAKEACDEYARRGEGSFAVIWAKSSTWGLCPRIEWRGEKAAHASGCGYDKLSAVVAEYLSPLVPEVGFRGGAGINSVIDCMKEYGWELKHTYDGKTEDGFELTKLP